MALNTTLKSKERLWWMAISNWQSNPTLSITNSTKSTGIQPLKSISLNYKDILSPSRSLPARRGQPSIMTSTFPVRSASPPKIWMGSERTRNKWTICYSRMKRAECEPMEPGWTLSQGSFNTPIPVIGLSVSEMPTTIRMDSMVRAARAKMTSLTPRLNYSKLITFKKKNSAKIINWFAIIWKQNKLYRRLRTRRHTSLFYRTSYSVFKTKAYWVSYITLTKITWIRVCTRNFNFRPISSQFGSHKVNRTRRTTRLMIKLMSKTTWTTTMMKIKTKIMNSLHSHKKSFSKYYTAVPLPTHHHQSVSCSAIMCTSMGVLETTRLLIRQSMNRSRLHLILNSRCWNSTVILRTKPKWVGVQRRWIRSRNQKSMYLSFTKRNSTSTSVRLSFSILESKRLSLPMSLSSSKMAQAILTLIRAESKEACCNRRGQRARRTLQII